ALGIGNDRLFARERVEVVLHRVGSRVIAGRKPAGRSVEAVPGHGSAACDRRQSKSVSGEVLHKIDGPDVRAVPKMQVPGSTQIIVLIVVGPNLSDWQVFAMI